MTFMDRLKKAFKDDAPPATPAPPAPAQAVTDRFTSLLARYENVRHRLLTARASGAALEALEREHADAEAALRACAAEPGSRFSGTALDERLLDVDHAWHVGELAQARYTSSSFGAGTPGDETSARRQARLAQVVDAEQQAEARLKEFCLATGRDLDSALRDVEQAMYYWLAK